MISAIVLSHNDQEVIAKTLKSVSWCDEIIVVDDESVDKTVDVAKKNGATVYKRRLDGDFAAQRNFGLSKAKGDWVLFVDSDEVVSSSLAKEIQESTDIDAVGFYLRREDTLFGKRLEHGETARVRLVRLAKKDAGMWVRPVHEVWQLKGLIGELKNPLVHTPHPTIAEFIEEINKYSTLNARFFYDKKVPVPAWHIIAYPVAKFFVDYVWYLGFLDGTAGAVVALMMSLHSFLTRAKLYLLWHPGEKRAT